MSNTCRVRYIDQNYKNYPELRDRLTDVYHEIWGKINKSNLFRKYGEGPNATFLFSSPDTKQYEKQIELIRDLSSEYGYPEGTSAVQAEMTKSLYNRKVLVNIHPIANQEYTKIQQNKPIQGTLFQLSLTEPQYKLLSFLNDYGFDINESENLLIDLANKTINLNTSDVNQVAKAMAEPLSEMLSYSNYFYEIENAVKNTSRFNDRLTELEKQYQGSTKRNLRRLATKEIFKDLLESGFSERLAKEMNVEKSLLEKIKQFISDLIDSLKYANWKVINKNIGEIVEKTFKSEDFIRLTKKEGYKEVNFQQAFDENQIAKDIMTKIGTNPNIVLTGSIAYSTQGTVYRKIETVVHDLDFVNNGLTKEQINELVLSNYPDSIKAYSFFDKYDVDTYLIPPKGIKIQNVQRRETGKITSYELVDSNNNVVGTYKLEYEVSGTGKTINETEIKTGVEAMLVDFFSNDTAERNTVEQDFIGNDGKTYQVNLSAFREPFEAKLRYSRFKDIWDYNRFIPSDRKKYVPPTASKTILSKASPKTIALVNDLLKRIGVDVASVKDIVVNGVKYDANAVANITQALVQVVEGKEAEALPEEAMHMVVAIIKQTNPKLYNQLLKEINNYNIKNQVFQEYGSNALYQKEGKPDVIKLKEEAIAKVLAEKIILKSEGLTEKPENLAKVETWWDNILDWLKSLFQIKSGFDQATLDILSGKEIGTIEDAKSNDVYFQLNKSAQDKVYDDIKNTKNVVEKKEDGYYINGKKTRRVTDLVDDWYKRRFGDNSLTNTEYEKAVFDRKAEKGTDGHKDIEHAFEMFVDENGYMRDTPLDDSTYVSRLDPNDRKMYEMLRDNLKARLESFGPGARFMSEATILDAKRNIAGTADFIAITKEGKVSILDWKFMDLNIDKYQDVPWYKVGAWNLQMEQYKYILQNAYGVKNENFEQTAMIPIKALYSKGNPKTGVLPKLLEIKIGDVNVKNITEDFLLPVMLQSQKTGSEEIDDLLEKLNAIYKRISERKAEPTETGKVEKAEQLNSLFYAIRQLQVKQNIAPLIYQAAVLNKQIENIINKFDNKFKGKDAKSFSEDEISDFTGEISSAILSLETYTNLDTELRHVFEGRQLSDEDKTLKENLRKAVDEARSYLYSLKKLDKKFTDDFIGKTADVEKPSTPEKIVKGIGKMFGNTATLQLKSVEILFKKANKAFALAGMDTLTEMRVLEDIKKKYESWARSKGLSTRNQFDILMKKDTNELIDEFNPEFYSTLRKKIAEKDTEWVRDNVDVEAFKEYMKAEKQKELERIANLPRIGTREEEYQIKRKISDAEALYDTSKNGLAWYQYNEVKKFPKRENWESNEWKTLNAKGNEPALEFYNYIKDRNTYFQSIGYINAKDARTFLPWVKKGIAEKFIFGGDMALGERFLRSISMDETDVGYGKTDPLTGKPIDKIPTYFTAEFEGDYSKDLFKNMALYNQYAIKFKYLTDIEEQGRALIRLEKNKKAIATSYFGKTEIKDGEIQYTPDNNENAKIVEDMVKAIVYQQKYIQSETFDQLLGKIGGFGAKINKKLGFNLLPEDLEGRQISLNKSITQLNNTFQLAALGLNTLSSMSNLFGGKTQSLINSGKYFTKTDFVSTEFWLLQNRMLNGDKVKGKPLGYAKTMIAAMDYFLPFTENYSKDIARDLSVAKINEEKIQDFLMILMRRSDRAVQATNFFSYLRNSIVQDGQVVNAREYLRSTPEYADMYAGTQSERDARASKFEEDVDKLVEEKGVLKLGKVNDKGEFEIPGVERKSDSVIKLRRIVQQISSDALGSLTEENKRLINLTVYGNSFMVFKNWIPRLVDVRLGNLKYNAAYDAYEWGRTRMIVRIVSEDLMKSLSLLKGSILGLNDKNVDFMRQLYEKKKADYERDTGKELRMTQSEFMDLVRQNIKNQILDVLVYAGLFALYLGIKALPPDDEDPVVKNQYKFMLKAVDKFKDEIGYFYDPTSVTKLAGGSGLFPSVSLIDNFRKGVFNFVTENYALATGNEDLAEQNKVIKYWLRSFPILSQGAGMLPIFYPELAKDLGIKMQSNYGMR